VESDVLRSELEQVTAELGAARTEYASLGARIAGLEARRAALSRALAGPDRRGRGPRRGIPDRRHRRRPPADGHRDVDPGRPRGAPRCRASSRNSGQRRGRPRLPRRTKTRRQGQAGSLCGRDRRAGRGMRWQRTGPERTGRHDQHACTARTALTALWPGDGSPTVPAGTIPGTGRSPPPARPGQPSARPLRGRAARACEAPPGNRQVRRSDIGRNVAGGN
jgi:hypothetical protein